MGQEERDPKRSISSYGGIRTRPSRKQKPKKVPRRGLGVAQLERIRIEEQQKNHASVAAVSTLTPPQDSDPDMSVPAKGTVPLAKALKCGGLENTGQYGTAYSNRNDPEVGNSCLPWYDPPPSSMIVQELKRSGNTAGECVDNFFIIIRIEFSDRAPFKPKLSWQLCSYPAGGREDRWLEAVMSILFRKAPYISGPPKVSYICQYSPEVR
ncbi:hypothetical protein BT93_F2630 [Corymbia citriodora subsp. variegata]|nr:hypothetical protein BT93_F2630 [Corymbia citriodora subsp. variegata]KAF8025852.1 hypothetical protein BT93_F2630 [Corymbia citriodora subsp. variegata]